MKTPDTVSSLRYRLADIDREVRWIAARRVTVVDALNLLVIREAIDQENGTAITVEIEGMKRRGYVERKAS